MYSNSMYSFILNVVRTLYGYSLHCHCRPSYLEMTMCLEYFALPAADDGSTIRNCVVVMGKRNMQPHYCSLLMYSEDNNNPCWPSPELHTMCTYALIYIQRLRESRATISPTHRTNYHPLTVCPELLTTFDTIILPVGTQKWAKERALVARSPPPNSLWWWTSSRNLAPTFSPNCVVCFWTDMLLEALGLFAVFCSLPWPYR